MKINYLGHSCFKIQFDNISVVTDPYTKIGYEMPHLCSDVLTCSHGHYDHNFIEKVEYTKLYVKSGKFTFEKQGESLDIQAIESWHDEKKGALRGGNLIFKFESDGVVVCHMGDIGECVNEQLLEKIGKIDILLIPVGGTYTVDALGASEWVKKIKPKIIIPMHYSQKTCSIDIVGVEEFLKLNSNIQLIKVNKEIHVSKNLLSEDKKIIIEMSGE